MTVTDSQRAASARTRSTVCASTGWSASTVWVTKTSRTSARRSGDRGLDERAHLAGELLGSRMPVGVARSRGRPIAARRARRSASTRSSAAASASESAGGTSRPSTSSVTRSGMPPPSVATTARPRANDFDDHPAETLRPRGQHEHRRGVELLGDSLGLEPLVVLDPAGEVRQRARRPPPAASRLPDDHEPRPRARAPRRDARRRRGPSTFLYGSSAPTKATVGVREAATGSRSANAERSLNAVKTARRRYAPRLLDEACGEASRRPASRPRAGPRAPRPRRRGG